MLEPKTEIASSAPPTRLKWIGARVYTPHATAEMDRLAGLPLASFKSRAAAFLLDMVLVLVAYMPTMWFIKWLEVRSQANPHIDLVWDFHEISNVIFTVLYFGLTLYWGKGRTLGKRILGIRVVSLVHDHLTFWQSIERALGYGASFLEGGFGFIQYFTHPNRCCVHDRIAETIVIRERRDLIKD
jgi:uncharacterized RDD family membrane protein YckC